MSLNKVVLDGGTVLNLWVRPYPSGGNTYHIHMTLIDGKTETSYQLQTQEETINFYTGLSPDEESMTLLQRLIYGLAPRLALGLLDPDPHGSKYDVEVAMFIVEGIREFCRPTFIILESGSAAPPTPVSQNLSMSSASHNLPGMRMLVTCPRYQENTCDSDWELTLKSLRVTIMHLNDDHQCTREEIADWLDQLYDDGAVDLAFKDSV